MGTVVDNSPFILYTEFHSFLNFLSIRVFSWPDFIICHVEYILACHILISEKEIVSVTRKVEKHDISCTKHMESCPQLATILNIAPLEIARFQRAVTSLFFA